MPQHAPGDTVWTYTGKETSFEIGTVERLDAHKGFYAVRLKAGVVDVKESDVHKTNNAAQDGVPDNTYLRELNEATLLHNVRTRYNSSDDGGCYSSTGHILIAVNPFRRLSIYEESDHTRYLSQAIGSQPPHIFAVADGDVQVRAAPPGVCVAGQVGRRLQVIQGARNPPCADQPAPRGLWKR
jgi:myosin heavy subunit